MIPTPCHCSAAFITDHTMVCHMGGFTTVPHDKLQHLITSILMEICLNVTIELHRQPLRGEAMALCSAVTDNGTQWYSTWIPACMLLMMHTLILDFHSNQMPPVIVQDQSQLYICDMIEHGLFTPLVFSPTGGLGCEAAIFYKCLAKRLACKQQKPYSIPSS